MRKGFHNTMGSTLDELFEFLKDNVFSGAAEMEKAQQILLITEDMGATYNLIGALNERFQAMAAEDPGMLYYPIDGVTDHEYKLVGDCGDGQVILEVDGRKAFYEKEMAYRLMQRGPTPLVNELKGALEGKQYGIALYTSELYPNPHHLQPMSTDFAADLGHWVVIGILSNDDEERFAAVFPRLKQPMAWTVFEG